MSSEKTCYCFEDVGIEITRIFFFDQYDLDSKQWFRSRVYDQYHLHGGVIGHSSVKNHDQMSARYFN